MNTQISPTKREKIVRRFVRPYDPSREKLEKVRRKTIHPCSSFIGKCSQCQGDVYLRISGGMVDHEGHPVHVKCFRGRASKRLGICLKCEYVLLGDDKEITMNQRKHDSEKHNGESDWLIFPIYDSLVRALRNHFDSNQGTKSTLLRSLKKGFYHSKHQNVFHICTHAYKMAIRAQKMRETKRKKQFRKFVEDLKKRGVMGEEYRREVEKWKKTQKARI